MKIVVFGATGNVGRQVVAEALRRGRDVVGVVRGARRTSNHRTRARSWFRATPRRQSVASVVRGADVVVSAISPRPNSRGLPAPSLVDNARALIEGLRQANVRRVLFVGWAVCLQGPTCQAIMVLPNFPPAYKAEATEGRDALNIWKSEASGLDWTYVSPAAEIAPGERTGRYRTTDETLLVDAKGRSFITFQDYAVALLDEIEHPKHVARRFGVAY